MDTIDELNKLTLQLKTARKRTNQTQESLDAEKAVRDGIQAQIIALMSDKNMRSYKNNTYNLSIATKKSLVVTDQKAIMTELKNRGVLKDFLKFDTVKATTAIKDEFKEKGFPGVEEKETEYISVREAK